MLCRVFRTVWFSHVLVSLYSIPNLKFCNLIQSRDASLCEVCASQADQHLNPVPSERGLVHRGFTQRMNGLTL